MTSVVIDAGGHAKVSLALVHGIVGQVHAEVVELSLACFLGERLVLSRCKPCKSFLVEEYFERITAEDEDVEPQVELQIVNEIWIYHVLLHHECFLRRDLIEVSRQEDAFPLTHAVWLHDHCEFCLCRHVGLNLRLPRCLDWRFVSRFFFRRARWWC